MREPYGHSEQEIALAAKQEREDLAAKREAHDQVDPASLAERLGRLNRHQRRAVIARAKKQARESAKKGKQ